MLVFYPRAIADPWVTDNADGTSTAVWNFSNPADYTQTNTQISGGAARLGSVGGVQWWNSTSAADFASPDSATNVNFASSPGDVLLAATSGPSTLLSLQPPPATGEDSWLDEANPGTVRGTNTLMRFDGSGNRHRPVLRFDLSSIPPGAVIDAATLNLYEDSGAGNTVVGTVQELTNSWNEAQATWDDRITGTAWASGGGGDFDAHVIDQITIDNTVGWRAWNITQLVDLWYRGVRPNNGMILLASDTGASADKYFRSSDHATVATRPQLDIRYRALGATGEYISRVGGPGTPTAWQTISWNPSVRSLVADEFNGASLDPKWTWINTPATYDVGTTVPGHLHVSSTTNSEILNAVFTGNALWDVVVGDFTASMKFSSNPSVAGHKVGLMALVSQRDWYSVGKENVGGTVNWRVRSTVDAVSSNLATAVANPVPAWVRIVRTGNTFQSYTSPDGTAWTLQNTYTPVYQYPSAIRLAFFVATGGSATALVADVDYVRVTHGAGATVSVSTRIGDTTPVDGTWSAWSASYAASSGSAMAGQTKYVQYRLSFSVAAPDHRPVVSDVNISGNTFSYLPAGTIETNDLVPGDLQQWGSLSVVDAPNGQTISYDYSLNSGGTWTPVAPPADLSGVSVATGRIRFRASLSTSNNQVTPTVSEIRLTYGHRLDHFYVTATASATAGAPFSVTVTAKDASNATIVAWTGTVTLDARLLDGLTPGGGVLGTTSLVISSGGTATLATETYTKAETIRIHVYVGVPEGLSGSVAMSPGAVTRVVVAPASAVLFPFDTQSFGASAFDAWDNPVPGAPFTWVVTNAVGTLNSSTGTSVQFTAQPPSGVNGTVEATSGGATGVAVVRVGTPILDHFYVTASASATAGAPFSVTVTAKDSSNATILSWTGTVTLDARLLDGVTPGVGVLSATSLAISSGGTATLATETYTKVETIRIHASFGPPEGLSGAIVMSPGSVARVTVAPSNLVILPSDNQTFTATAYDAWDNPVPGAPFTWVVTNGIGTLNSSAGPSVLFTAQPPLGANGTVEATSAGFTGVANVTVGSPVPPWVVISSPVPGAHITGAVSIAYTNSADASLLTFEYNAGAGWFTIGSTSSPSGSFPWNTVGVDATGVTLRARVENAFSMTNSTSVSPIEVDNTPPTISIGTVTDDQATSGTLTIAYTTATDVIRVDLTYFDGVWRTIGSDVTVDGSYAWTPGVPINGVTIRAVAVDEVGLWGVDQKAGVGTFVIGTNPPTISAIPDLHVRTGLAYDLNLTFYLSDSDTSLGGLTLWTSDPTNVSTASGSFPSLRVTYGTAGTYDVTLWVSDGTDTAWIVVRVIASSANPPALVSALGTATFDEDTTLVDALGNLTTRFTDAEGDILVFAILGASQVSWRVNADATLDFWATADWSGSELVRLRATDPAGGFAEAPLLVDVRPVNDAPVLASLARLQWTAGQSHTFDLTPYVSDIDTPLSQIVVTTDSPYVRVAGLVLTMSFPSNWTSAQFTVTASDGLAEASQPLRVTLLPAPWNPWFLLPIPPAALALVLVVGMIAKRANSRPAKAFIVDEKGELIREVVFDTGCLVTWGQVQAAGVFNMGGNPIKIGSYQAQAVRGDALAVIIVSYGAVTKELVEFAREMVVNVQAKFDDRVKARLQETRDYETRASSMGEDLRKRHQTLDARSRAFEGMFDQWTRAQSKIAAESVAVHATVKDVERREGTVLESGRRYEEGRASLTKEREEFRALADRLKGEMDRRNKELEEREASLKTASAKVNEEQKTFDATRKEKLERLAARDVEIEAKAQTFADREAAVKAQGEENARLLSDLAAREETLEIESDRVEKLRRELEQTKSELDGSSGEIQAREVALREQEARTTQDLKKWQALLESREAVLREKSKAFEEQMSNLQATVITKQQALDGREGKVGELESKVRAEADRVKQTIEDIGKREQAAQDALLKSRQLKEEVEEAHDALARRGADLDAREAALKGEADRRQMEVARREEAIGATEAGLATRKQEIESAERFLDRQMTEIHESTRNLTRREAEVSAVEQDRGPREAKLAARAKELEAGEQAVMARQKAIDEETARFARTQLDFDMKRKEFENRISSADAILAGLANREKEVLALENAQKSREAAVEAREAEFFGREVAFRESTAKYDETIRGLEQREAVLGSRTAKLEEDFQGLAKLREETMAEKEFAEHTKAAADTQQAEVARTMKFLQKKAVDILDREEQLRKREKKLEETENILDSQVEIVETQRNAIEMERGESRGKFEKFQAEIERLKVKLAEAEKAPPMATVPTAELEKDIENRLKIIQQKAFALLDREERLREREEELNARERLIPRL